jgi:phosphoribosylformimino-5-aminoimidazole carboxamide ribotide isomerase
MLIPCIDIMGGKVVQLIQGEKKALELKDPEPWLRRFESYPLVHVVDLDAAMERGSNRAFISRLADRLPCQVGGGVRNAADARELLAIGAKRVVVGSALVTSGLIDTSFARSLTQMFGVEKLVFAVDARHGQLAVRGWTETVSVTSREAIYKLEDYCSAFLYTNVDGEGLLGGFPIKEAQSLRAVTKKQLIVGGGINSLDQITQLDTMGIDSIAGMAIYTDTIPF